MTNQSTSNQRGGPPPIVYIALVLGLTAGGYWFFRHPSAPSGLTLPKLEIPGLGKGSKDSGLSISRGDRSLFTDSTNQNLQEGIAAFSAGDYSAAATQFAAARQRMHTDPEPLIYLNNARIGSQTALGVAVVVPISDSANVAREILRGVAQAQSEALQAGIPIRVLIADDGNEPERATAIANALIKDETIVAVIGHGTSRTTLAVAPLYQQANLPLIAPTSTTTELATIPRQNGNFIFRVVPSDQFTGTSLARYMLSRGKNQPLVVYNSQSSYSKSLLEVFSTTLGLEGGQVVKTIDLSQPNPENALQNSGADALVLFPDSTTFDLAISVVQANQGKLPIFAGDSFYRIETLQKAGSSLQGAVLAVPWHRQKALPQFIQAANQLWGGDINWRTALSYDAFQVLRTAQATGQITGLMGVQGRSKLEQVLASPGFFSQGSTGKIIFLPSGDRNATVLLVQIKPGKRSGTGFDFLPL
ncbi:MAG: ABC transporter substrate-binding protein [Nodosilinea sp. LVE1205-7]|jgi:branched-chain amino acid transport system substrate-binding protein